MAAGSALRLAHTAVLAAVCVVVSGLGHALASGASPPLRAYALALPPVLAAGWRLTRRERSARAVVAASAAGQLALHVLFGLVSHGPAAPGHPPGHPAPGGTSLAGLTVSAEAVTASLTASLTSGMAGAHVLAGAVCGWWLWRGERALVQLGRALALFADGPLHSVRTAILRTALIEAVLRGTLVPPPAPAVPAGPPEPARMPAFLLPLRTLSRRGPPLLPS
ncbi:hypothetical protein [Streptomyces yaizuensis]|uniref:PE-PGRS family protein n=1 Tax=Streptomyces yaizuensis TaxID=2989713 RepID=A0ABQ5NZQ8_9ACTN|nr:hypothetical protein [Streptomyces sp. YSPA8]GLF95845.1 PE-PGRS family protein [Streptomyces sp. YSPA8]